MAEGGVKGEWSKLTIAMAVVGISSWLVALWFGVNSACSAYYATPDIADFGSFALSRNVGMESKVKYLFSLTIAALVIGLLLVFLRESWLVKMERMRLDLAAPYRLRLVLLAIVGWIFLVGTRINNDYAVAAAERIHWSGQLLPNPIVDTVCVPFKKPKPDR